MSPKPFDTKSPDGIPLWKKLYDFAIEQPLDRVIRFDELSKVMGYPIEKNRTAIYEANKHLLTDHNRMLVNIRKTGYKIATSSEQLCVARTRPKRAKRQLSQGIKEAENIDTKSMTPQERDTQMQLLLKMQVSLSTLRRRQYQAQASQEKAVQEQKHAINAQKDAQEAISDLEEKIEELKNRLPETKPAKKSGKIKYQLPGMKGTEVLS